MTNTKLQRTRPQDEQRPRSIQDASEYMQALAVVVQQLMHQMDESGVFSVSVETTAGPLEFKLFIGRTRCDGCTIVDEDDEE